MGEQYISLGEAAKRLGIQPYRLVYAISCGKVPDSEVRLAGRRAFTESELLTLGSYFAGRDLPKKGARQ